MNLLKKSWPFIFLTALSLIIHFSFLSYPSQVVFDEVHFGKFAAAYSTGQYYFDIHPPLGKLMIAGFTKLAGIDPVFDFNNIGENMPAGTLFAMRFLPALFGALFVLAFSWLAWLATRDKKIALLAGFLILLDNAFLVQSKFILVDIFMLFFEVLTLCFFFLWQRQKSFGAKWFSYLFLTAIFFGLTISIKWTGLATIGIIGVILFIKIFSKKISIYLSHPEPPVGGEGSLIDSSASTEFMLSETNVLGLRMTKLNLLKEWLVGFSAIILIGFLVYLIPFYIHFDLLPNSGPGDAFMSPQFRQELQYGRANVYQPLPFWQKFTELNKTMYTASTNLTTEHPFGSKWYSWPLNSKPVYYWNRDEIASRPDWQAKIFFSGNPAIWLIAAIGIIFVLIKLATKKGRRDFGPFFFILLIAYFANLLPFIFIKRVAFLYHYLPPAIYANFILTLLLAKLWPKEKNFFTAAIIFVILGFILLSPLSYGWPMPPKLDWAETNFIGLFH
ncbi:MAG: phospholipid carrier-dependent glycosyltransferase [Candidatus Portnoybacteria bacterium]|nr:phospholipid carrier-dependent glycosyltransferase [Candidatus Portnoybacteria bacterium]MDD4982925.1 phospholipid carrier-dependent glycosyltransferase [Candidatus Portnoybacteria bacterium]